MNTATHAATKTFPTVTIALILANSVAFIGMIIAYNVGGWDAVKPLTMVPSQVTEAFRIAEPTSLLAAFATIFLSMFLHGNLVGIVGNMFFLGMFGPAVERRLGTPLFLATYFGCGFAAVIPQILSDATSTTSFLGAGTAVAGVLAVYTWLCLTNQLTNPTSKVHKLVVLAVTSLEMGFQLYGVYDVAHGGHSSIAHWAMVGGFLTGLAVIFVVLLSMSREVQMPSAVRAA